MAANMTDLVSIDLRELAVVLSLVTKSWLHRERRPGLWLLLVSVNTLKIGDASTCNHQRPHDLS